MSDADTVYKEQPTWKMGENEDWGDIFPRGSMICCHRNLIQPESAEQKALVTVEAAIAAAHLFTLDH